MEQSGHDNTEEKMLPSSTQMPFKQQPKYHQHYCASERFYRKIKNEKSDDDKKLNINKKFSDKKSSTQKFNKRRKRWLPEEVRKFLFRLKILFWLTDIQSLLVGF